MNEAGVSKIRVRLAVLDRRGLRKMPNSRIAASRNSASFLRTPGSHTAHGGDDAAERVG